MQSLRKQRFVGSHVEDVHHSVVDSAGADEVGVHVVAVEDDRGDSSSMCLHFFETFASVDILRYRSIPKTLQLHLYPH